MAVYGEPRYLPVDEAHPLQPQTFYAAGKTSAEAYIKLYQTLGINTTIFRLFNVYGPGQNLANKMQGMVSIYLSFILEGSPIMIRGPAERFRDFIYIGDVVDAWFRAFSLPGSSGKIYNLASGEKASVKELINILRTTCGNKGYPVKYGAGTPGDQSGIFADISLIRKELDWKPRIALEKGCRIFYESERRKTRDAR
jgi:UDP-glucose 4-epimerase